jgi:hypothetical protein
MKSSLSRHRFLGATSVAILAYFLVSLSLAQAQIADRPKVAPEQHQLAMFVGEWSYEGTVKDSVTGPGGHYVGKETVRFTMDGLFLESHGRDKGVYGGKEIVWEGMGLRWYDTAVKQYKSQSFNNDGFVDSGTLTVAGRTWRYMGGSRSIGAKGQQFLNRNTTTFATDGKTQTTKGETSYDNGKTWSVIWEGTGKKTKD